MALDSEEKLSVVSTGNAEVDRKLGGGIPIGSLTLIEGQSDSGKSVLAQHFISGSLKDGMKSTVFTTENSVKSLVRQMDSLNLNILDYLLLGRVKIFPVRAMKVSTDMSLALEALLEAMVRQKGKDLIIVDSITSFVAHTSIEQVISFFEECKVQCDRGTSIVLVAHSYAFSGSMLVRISSMSDAHIRMSIETMGDKLMKILEVSKVRGAQQTTGNVITFDVEPGWGIKVLPFSKAKA